MPLNNCEINLVLTWSEICVLISKSTREKSIGTGTDENPQFSEINNPTNATFKITETELFVPVVPLSAKYDSNFLEQLKSGFKRTIKWNKDRSEMTKTNHLNHLIDLTFTNVNRLDKRQDMSRDRTYFSKYYVPKFEIKDFNVLIDRKPFLMWQ